MSRALLIGVLIIGGLSDLSCSQPPAEKSTGSNWLACRTDSDCASVPGARCVARYCVDRDGKRILASNGALDSGAGGTGDNTSASGGGGSGGEGTRGGGSGNGGSGGGSSGAPDRDSGRPVTIPPKDGGPTLAACTTDQRGTIVAVLGNASPGDALALDAQHLYLATSPAYLDGGGQAEILAVPLPCGAASLVTRSERVATGPVLAEGALYWIDGGGLAVVPVEGGVARTLVASRPTPLSPRYYSPALAVQDGYAYWADVDGTVSRVAVAGGTVQTLASGYGSPGAIALGGGYVYWASVDDPPHCPSDGGDCTMSGFSFSPAATIFRVPIDGGDVSTVVAGQIHTDSILAASGDLYWGNLGGYGVDFPLRNGAVMRLPASGGAPVAIATSVAASSLQLAGSSLYWLDHLSLFSAAIASEQQPNPVANGPMSPGISALVASSTRLYWVEDGFDAGATVIVYSSPQPR